MKVNICLRYLPLNVLLQRMTLIQTYWLTIIDSMDIEYDGSSAEVASALRRIENIERRLHAIKVFSQSRRTARKQLLMQKRKAQMRKLSQHEEEAARSQGGAPKYRKDSLKGLVVQVPESLGVREAEVDPYSPRSASYYVSEVVKSYKQGESAAREHLTQSIQILKTLENSKMPGK